MMKTKIITPPDISEGSEPPIYPTPKPETDRVVWSDLQRKFDSIVNIDEIFYYLRDIIDKLHICNSAECPIFHELHNLDLQRMNFVVKTIKEAEIQIKNKMELSKFTEVYQEYIVASKQTFSKIYALKIQKDALEKKSLESHLRFLEILDKFNRNHTPIPVEFVKGMQKNVDAYGEALNIDDPRILEANQDFKSQMKENSKR